MFSSRPEPLVIRGEDAPFFTSVRGVFYRAVHPDHVDSALSGSRTDGRYAPAHRPTLYLSSSPERAVAPMEVTAERIADLRDTSARAALGVDPAEAALDWQQALAHGEIPASWRVRGLLQDAGAAGLIDPSRKRPGLWHLTLFAWNQEGAPSVRWLVEPGSP